MERVLFLSTKLEKISQKAMINNLKMQKNLKHLYLPKNTLNKSKMGKQSMIIFETQIACKGLILFIYILVVLVNQLKMQVLSRIMCKDFKRKLLYIYIL